MACPGDPDDVLRLVLLAERGCRKFQPVCGREEQPAPVGDVDHILRLVAHVGGTERAKPGDVDDVLRLAQVSAGKADKWERRGSTLLQYARSCKKSKCLERRLTGGVAPHINELVQHYNQTHAVRPGSIINLGELKRTGGSNLNPQLSPQKLST